MTVPLDPKAGGGYLRAGRRLTYETPAFILAAEPIDGDEVRSVFRERAGMDRNPFTLPGQASLQVFRVTIVNRGRDDLAFNALYATLDAEGRYSYHMSPAELLEELRPAYPDIDIDRAIQRTVFEASVTVNPKRYLTRLMVFPPIHPEVRALTLGFTNLGIGDKMTDVVFPFKVAERDDWDGEPTPPFTIPAECKEQLD